MSLKTLYDMYITHLWYENCFFLIRRESKYFLIINKMCNNLQFSFDKLLKYLFFICWTSIFICWCVFVNVMNVLPFLIHKLLLYIPVCIVYLISIHIFSLYVMLTVNNSSYLFYSLPVRFIKMNYCRQRKITTLPSPTTIKYQRHHHHLIIIICLN